MDHLVELLEKIGSSNVHYLGDKAGFMERLSETGLNASAVDRALEAFAGERDSAKMICMIWAPDEVPDVEADIADLVERDIARD
jgi:hypothetical protein